MAIIPTDGNISIRTSTSAESERSFSRFRGPLRRLARPHQLPEFESLYNEFRSHGLDEIYCIAVNDSFVMNGWGSSQNIENVKLVPDGSGEFTRKMGMLVDKDNLGLVMRSWRYAAIMNDGSIESWFEEPGYSDNCETDPYGESSPRNILNSLKGN